MLRTFLSVSLIKTVNPSLNRYPDPRGCIWFYDVLNSLSMDVLIDSVGWSLYPFLFYWWDKILQTKQLNRGRMGTSLLSAETQQQLPEQEAHDRCKSELGVGWGRSRWCTSSSKGPHPNSPFLSQTAAPARDSELKYTSLQGYWSFKLTQFPVLWAEHRIPCSKCTIQLMR